MREREVIKVLGVSRSTLHRMVARKDFPAPYKIGSRSIAWRSDEVFRKLESFERLENHSEAMLPREDRLGFM